METDKLCLALSNGNAWELILTPVALEAGLPVTIIFQARLRFDHPTGKFCYTADDLTFMPSSFSDLAGGLDGLLKGQREDWVCGAIGDKLQLAFARRDRKKVSLEIRVHEFQPNEKAAELILPTTLSDYDSVERLQRRASAFVADLAGWIEEQHLIAQ